MGDVVAELSPWLGPGKAAELPVVVVGSKSVVSASLHVGGSQIPTEGLAVTEQVVGDLRGKKSKFIVRV